MRSKCLSGALFAIQWSAKRVVLKKDMRQLKIAE
jgi:hypothetical protein